MARLGCVSLSHPSHAQAFQSIPLVNDIRPVSLANNKRGSPRSACRSQDQNQKRISPVPMMHSFKRIGDGPARGFDFDQSPRPRDGMRKSRQARAWLSLARRRSMSGTSSSSSGAAMALRASWASAVAIGASGAGTSSAAMVSSAGMRRAPAQARRLRPHAVRGRAWQPPSSPRRRGRSASRG